MNSRFGKGGFTLVEILVAMAIIVAIVSMVYGSYFATSRSTQAYKTRIALFQQGRKVLGQMARQIRCSYAGTDERHTQPTTSISQQRNGIPENTINYFDGNQDEPSGEILHLVTTTGDFGKQDTPNGLSEVTYKFDKTQGVLFSNHRRFIGTSEDAAEKRSWRPITRNIEHIELTFFDGQQWLQRWNFKDSGKLPCAVKINITYEDENYQQYHYGTVAYVCCRKNQGEKTRADTSVSLNKQ